MRPCPRTTAGMAGTQSARVECVQRLPRVRRGHDLPPPWTPPAPKPGREVSPTLQEAHADATELQRTHDAKAREDAARAATHRRMLERQLCRSGVVR